VEEQLPARFGPFVLLSLLGSGGMGRAYLARHRDWPGRLVVKRMHVHLLADEGLLKRFEHEARVATCVRHPNVAALVAMGTVESEPFFATEHVLGLSLTTLVERVEAGVMEPLPLDVALELAVGIARGVEAIHEAVNSDTGVRLDLVHRDLGARNILVGTDGRPKIIDLGLGKSVMADWQTATNMVAGSPDYMPPEQALGRNVDRRADVYSAAVTIWELLSGHKRIREPSIPQRLARAIEAQPEPLLTHRPDASPRLEAILQQAMAPRVESRTPTSTLLRTALERELEQVVREAERAGRRTDPARWLATACATALAKETRAIEEAEEHDPWRGQSQGGFTQILVAHQLFKPDSQPRVSPVRRGDTDLEDGAVDTLLRRNATPRLEPRDTAVVPAVGRSSVPPPAPSSPGSRPSIPALSAAAVRALQPSPQSIRAMLIGVAAVAIFLLGVWWARRAPTVEVEALTPPKPSPATIFSGLPPPPSLAGPGPAPSATTEPGVAGEAGEAGEATEATPSPTALAPIPTSVQSAKPALVERIRALRKTRYEGEFQRRLTALSARVSRARTDAEIAEITGQISRLERQ
jgi:serine/threonine protein kinase